MTAKKIPLVEFSFYEESNIILAGFPAGLKVDIHVAKEVVESRLIFTQNKEHYLVLDFSNIKEVSSEAKEYMQHPDGGLKNILGAALIATNPVASMIANVFMKTPKHFQAKFFSEREEGLQWIKGLQKQRVNNVPQK
jgi:hypothetical protein